jgi:sodium-independent sulfate anion transporter 11
MAPNQFGDRVKRFFGIDAEDRLDDHDLFDDGSFVEEEPSARVILEYFIPSLAGVQKYLRELFPFWNWIFHYNLTWLLGDIIAGECLRSNQADTC